jgi:hypothetical protein
VILVVKDWINGWGYEIAFFYFLPFIYVFFPLINTIDAYSRLFDSILTEFKSKSIY